MKPDCEKPWYIEEFVELVDKLIKESYFVASCEEMCPDAVAGYKATVERFRDELIDVYRKALVSIIDRGEFDDIDDIADSLEIWEAQ